MKTITRLGPTDKGKGLTLEEFLKADYQEGYQYELIEGRLFVSPVPDAPEGLVEDWLCTKLKDYAKAQPSIINKVLQKARVFIPGRPRATCPEPDVAAYQDFPAHLPFREIRWEDVSPLLTAEVLSANDPDKDLVRNVKLYRQVPTVREYWVLDTREDPERPRLYVYRRRGRRWQRVITIEPGNTYTTNLLSGFALVLDPHA
jgi:Uma2 family endonuclease